MIHDARIIHLDGRPHPPSSMRSWMGDSIGRWEGGTLVVDFACHEANYSLTNMLRGYRTGG